MIVVLDACAIIAFLRAEEGATEIENLLVNPDNACLIHAVNLCEVYYDVLRVGGESQAVSALQDVTGMGIAIREDMDTAFWRRAGAYKATIKRISLADCFAIALANRLNGVLLTADHREFDPVAMAGACQISFFR